MEWRSGKRGFAVLLALLGVLAVACWPAAARAASWFVDEAGFHASAHRDIACADCHPDQADGDHPRLDKLNKAASTAFNRETCLMCHAAVEEELAQGRHAGKPLMKTQDYNRCVACHNPHTVLGPEARAKGLTPQSDMRAACNVCHEAKKDLPKPAPEVAACFTCHGRVTGGAAAAGSAVFARGKSPTQPVMCLSCHGPEAQGPARKMDSAAFAAMTHGDMNCLTCHKEAARFPHNRQAQVNCLACHTRHDEKTIHEAHSRVDCGACHLAGVTPVRTAEGRVGFTVNAGSLQVHSMALKPGTASCVRCHSAVVTPQSPAGNGAVGAANAVLPPKSVLCMGCHAATFSVQDTPSRLGLAVFLLGFAVLGLFWLSTTNLGKGEAKAVAADAKTGDAAAGQTHGCAAPAPHAPAQNRWRAFFGDVFLQGRLYREAPLRWAVHACIFFPFLFRCAWGLLGLLGSLWAPAAQWPWLLLNKDWGPTALLYDLSGLVLLAGLTTAAVLWRREKKTAANAPRHDWPALWLLLAITLTGFVLEGLRIALTGLPQGSAWAFAGYALAQVFAAASPSALARVYGWGWYAHAVITALTVAYIPFSQLRHIFTSPLYLLVQTLRGRH